MKNLQEFWRVFNIGNLLTICHFSILFYYTLQFLCTVTRLENQHLAISGLQSGECECQTEHYSMSLEYASVIPIPAKTYLKVVDLE